MGSWRDNENKKCAGAGGFWYFRGQEREGQELAWKESLTFACEWEFIRDFIRSMEK
jgi:hypothetical protein